MAHEKAETIHHDPEGRSDWSGPPKSSRLGRVCSRWWWLFFLLFVILVLAVVLPIIYIGYPKIARRATGDSTLQITSMTIQNPTPDSVEMGLTQVFYSNKSSQPTLYPFNASFYMLDNDNNPPFASIQTPKIVKVSNDTETEVPLQLVNITHMDEFTRYLRLALASESYTIALRGNGGLSTGALPKTGIDYDKNITMNGFNGFTAFGILSFGVLDETEADGTNAIGKAAIVNPTVVTLGLGDVTFALSVNGTDIGVATLNDLVVIPGYQEVEIRAALDQLAVAGIVLARQNPILPIDFAGGNSTVDGQQIPYFTAMLKEVALQNNIDVTQAMESSELVDRRSLIEWNSR